MAPLASPPLHNTCITSPSDVTGVTHSSALCLVFRDHFFFGGRRGVAMVFVVFVLPGYKIVTMILCLVVIMITMVHILAVLLPLVVVLPVVIS